MGNLRLKMYLTMDANIFNKAAQGLDVKIHKVIKRNGWSFLLPKSQNRQNLNTTGKRGSVVWRGLLFVV